MKRWDLLAVGEAMIELAADTAGDDARTFSRSVGGDTLNALAMAQTLGARTAYATRLGDDLQGAYFQRFLADLGTDLSLVRRVAGFNGLYLIFTDADGERHFQYFRAGSAASSLRTGDVDDAALAGARVLYASGISQAISPTAEALIAEAFARARAHACRTYYDVNFRPALTSLAAAAERLAALLPSLDGLFMSDADMPVAEAALGLGQGARSSRADLLAALQRRGPAEVVLKAGREPTHGLGPEGQVLTLRPPVVDAVDTSGAGDTFNGGFLAAAARGLGFAERLRWGVAASALSVTKRGTIRSQPSAAEVAALLGSF